jgi:hypothetical protein
MEAGFEVLRPELAEAVRQSIDQALELGVEFAAGRDADSIFRGAIGRSIKAVELDPRGELCQRLLRDDPFGARDPNDKGIRRALNAHEIAETLFFVRYSICTEFQGSVGELLAAGQVARLFRGFERQGRLPKGCRIGAGDRVSTSQQHGKGKLKGPDFLAFSADGAMTAHGIAEVKSYKKRHSKLFEQIGGQVARMRSGISLGDSSFRGAHVAPGFVRVAVLPADWKLPRGFRLETEEGRTWFVPDAAIPSRSDEAVIELDMASFAVTLSWSREALAEAGMALTMCYMQQVGEAIYRGGVPREWAGMSPAEAGDNAARMVLHQAVIYFVDAVRASTQGSAEAKRLRLAASTATLLYNTYCFGYAIAKAHGYRRRRPRMLFYEDLVELAGPAAPLAGVVDK